MNLVKRRILLKTFVFCCAIALSLGRWLGAYAALGDPAEAERHLEKAMDLDPLNLAAASQLISLYKTNGDAARADQLSQRITSMVETGKHEP